MSRAVVLGERNLILGFKGVGFEIVQTDKVETLQRELMRLARDSEVALVLVTESMAAEAPSAIEEFRHNSTSILSIIPTHEGSQHLSFHAMKKAMERSIGVDILGNE